MARRSGLELVFADKRGKIFNFPGLDPAGMKAGSFFRLDPKTLLKLPSSSEFFMLSARRPVGLDKESGATTTLESDPYTKSSEPAYAVAAFIPPGYTLTHNAAYSETAGAAQLPLFAYGACAFYQGDFYVSAVRVDRGHRHDERYLAIDAVRQGVASYKKIFPGNRLVFHLANCATVNGCANAKNFFLGRFEAPVPVSPVCNAQCQGCISLQPDGRDFPETQKRITFIPTPEEIAELVIHHFETEKDPIASFGQGCEGEPTLQNDVLEKAIRLIRRETSKGRLNLNSNASRPQVLARLFDAGLTNMRVSTNSVREPYYSRYYQPKGYSFKEVTASVDLAKKHGVFVSMNYLSMPGFTDSEKEFEALRDFIRRHRVDMIQWRNLNYDPMQYFRDLKLENEGSKMIGMKEVLAQIQKEFPTLLSGYFNPNRRAVESVDSIV